MRTKLLALTLIFLFALSGFLSLNVHAQIVGSGAIDQGLVGYWRLDENTGVSCSDSSGNGFTGTATTGTAWGTGKYNSCLDFNGTSQKITVSDNTALQLGAAFSICTWFNTTTTGNLGLVNKGSGTGSLNYDLFLASGQVKGWCSNGTAIAAIQSPVSPTYKDGLWHLAIFINNGTYLHLYIDGSEIATPVAFLGTPITSTASLAIGYDAYNGVYFVGKIDGVRIYNRVLTASEIVSLNRGVYISVTNDLGSTITPNGTVNVGVDQTQIFNVGALTGYSPWTQYLDGLAYAPLANFGVICQSNRTLYITSQYIGYAPTNTPTSTPTPSSLAALSLPEILLTIFLFFFTLLAFFTREPFLFGLSAFISIIFGIDVGLLYTKDMVNNWMLGIVGAGLIFFGLFLLVFAFNSSLKGGKK